jgi:hypothetical protein
MFNMGISEILIICFVGIFAIGLPVILLWALYLIYNKLKAIEDFLKKKQD